MPNKLIPNTGDKYMTECQIRQLAPDKVRFQIPSTETEIDMLVDNQVSSLINNWATAMPENTVKSFASSQKYLAATLAINAKGRMVVRVKGTNAVNRDYGLSLHVGNKYAPTMIHALALPDSIAVDALHQAQLISSGQIKAASTYKFIGDSLWYSLAVPGLIGHCMTQLRDMLVGSTLPNPSLAASVIEYLGTLDDDLGGNLPSGLVGDTVKANFDVIRQKMNLIVEKNIADISASLLKDDYLNHINNCIAYCKINQEHIFSNLAVYGHLSARMFTQIMTAAASTYAAYQKSSNDLDLEMANALYLVGVNLTEYMHMTLSKDGLSDIIDFNFSTLVPNGGAGVEAKKNKCVWAASAAMKVVSNANDHIDTVRYLVAYVNIHTQLLKGLQGLPERDTLTEEYNKRIDTMVEMLGTVKSSELGRLVRPQLDDCIQDVIVTLTNAKCSDMTKWGGNAIASRLVDIALFTAKLEVTVEDAYGPVVYWSTVTTPEVLIELHEAFNGLHALFSSSSLIDRHVIAQAINTVNFIKAYKTDGTTASYKLADYLGYAATNLVSIRNRINAMNTVAGLYNLPYYQRNAAQNMLFAWPKVYETLTEIEQDVLSAAKSLGLNSVTMDEASFGAKNIFAETTNVGKVEGPALTQIYNIGLALAKLSSVKNNPSMSRAILMGLHAMCVEAAKFDSPIKNAATGIAAWADFNLEQAVLDDSSGGLMAWRMIGDYVNPILVASNAGKIMLRVSLTDHTAKVANTVVNLLEALALASGCDSFVDASLLHVQCVAITTAMSSLKKSKLSEAEKSLFAEAKIMIDQAIADPVLKTKADKFEATFVMIVSNLHPMPAGQIDNDPF